MQYQKNSMEKTNNASVPVEKNLFKSIINILDTHDPWHFFSRFYSNFKWSLGQSKNHFKVNVHSLK